jgi:hypothetical protein
MLCRDLRSRPVAIGGSFFADRSLGSIGATNSSNNRAVRYDQLRDCVEETTLKNLWLSSLSGFNDVPLPPPREHRLLKHTHLLAPLTRDNNSQVPQGWVLSSSLLCTKIQAQACQAQ